MHVSFHPFLGYSQLICAPPAEAHRRKFVVTNVCSEHFCSLPLSFILITIMIVAEVQLMARNEKRRKGCSDNLRFEKDIGRAERQTGWLRQKGHKIWRETLRKELFWGGKICVKFGAKVCKKSGPLIYSTENSTQTFTCLVSKEHALFEPFFLAFPLLALSVVPRTVPFFIGRNKASQRLRTRSATRLQHNISMRHRGMCLRERCLRR